MRKSLKALLIAAAVCVLLGLCITGISVAAGAVLPGVIKEDSIVWRRLIGSYGKDSVEIDTGTAASMETAAAVPADSWFDLPEKLEIDVQAARAEVLEADVDRVEVIFSSEYIEMKYKTSENELRLTFKKSSSILNLPSGESVTVRIPKGYRFKEAGLQAEAGSIHADSLYAEKLELSADAAEVTVDRAAAAQIDLEVNAGSIVVSDGETEEMTAKSAVGSIGYTGAVEKSLKADCEMGDIELTLYGDRGDFNYDLEKDLGVIKIDGISRTAGEESFESAEKKAKLDCELGNIALDFAGPREK